MAENIVIRNTQAPGDYIVLTAALRDIDTQYPGRFHFIADIPQPDILRHNPHVEIGHHRGRRVVATYHKSPYGIQHSNQNKNHFLWGFLGDLNMALGTHAVLGAFKPDIYISEEEKATPVLNLDKPYWVFASGGKLDYTAKIWESKRWQEVVDRLRGDVVMVQVGGSGMASNIGHIHPAIRNSYDLTGKTSFRELMRLIYHAHGVICVVTCFMHIAAGYNKPCIVVAGGREPWTWEAYNEENRLVNMRIGVPGWNPPPGDNFVPHRFIHTIGQLPCCHSHGCWKSRVVKINPCTDVVNSGGTGLPRCLSLITPEMVLDDWKWYYDSGILSLGRKYTLTIPEPPVLKEPVPLPEPEAPKVSHSRAAEVHVFVYVEKGVSPGYAQKLAQLTEGRPVTFSRGENRPEFMAKSVQLSQKEAFVWFEYPLMPLPGFFSWSSFTDRGLGAILCWKRVTPVQEALVRSAHWYREHGLKRHKFDGVTYVIYPRKGFFTFNVGVLKEIGWPDLRSEDVELMLGAAVEQLGLPVVDVGHMIGEYS